MDYNETGEPSTATDGRALTLLVTAKVFIKREKRKAMKPSLNFYNVDLNISEKILKISL